MNDVTRYICLFHDRDRARAAVTALEGLNVARGSISSLGDSEASTGMTGSQALTDLGVPERDLHHLQDGLRRGGVLVSLQAPEDQSGAIEKVFHHYSADKIDEAEYGDTGDTVAAAPIASEAATGVVAGDAVIPIAQEELVVGKREVERGGVRVFRRTVEEPVSEDVSLHDERVVVQHRQVDRPVTESDLRAGSQQIELVETAEVPVVQKVARVVEEVRVGKVASDHTEVIEDTVRHTEVDVQPVESTSATSVTDKRLRD